MLAGTQREQPPQKFQAVLHRRSIGIGPKIPRPILHKPPGDKNPGESLLHGNFHIGIALVILEADIIVGTVLLDEVAFQNQSLHLGARHDGLEICNMGNHCPNLGSMVLATLEILPHPVLQHHSLAHIDDSALLILHEINPGTVRQEFQFFLYCFCQYAHPQ